MCMDTAIVALGGNTLSNPGKRFTDEEQFKTVNLTIKRLLKLFEGRKVVLTHGNGPQVGDLYLQQERTKKEVSPLSLHTCVAMTQGQLGYHIQRSLASLGISGATIVTQVVVDPSDPAFKNPTKPIGPYYEEKKSEWNMEKKRGGWRRVVPSPKPVEIVEIKEIKKVLSEGTLAISCGGGGIPVVKEGNELVGVDAVIDKDKTSSLLAKELEAKELYIVTDVPYVYQNYGKKNQEKILEMSLREAKELIEKEEFEEGSMKPKIEAAVDFLESGGEEVLITNSENVIKGKGTKLKG